MAKTIVSLFQNPDNARHAMDELVRMGLERQAIEVFPTVTKQQQQTGRAEKSDAMSGDQLIAMLTNSGVPSDDARRFEDAVRHGNILVKLTTDDATAERAASILDTYGRMSPDRGHTEAAPAATQPIPPATQPIPPATPTERVGQELRPGEEARIPVVEEEIRVGKREVEEGGVRVTSQVTERPVEEQVQLREERVTVERHPVDRPASEADLAREKGQTIEVRETTEEPIIQKSARVVEEVVVGREERERTETVQGTERRKDVTVEEIPPGERTRRDFSSFENDFRAHCMSTQSGASYDECLTAYRFGFDRSSESQYSGRQWADAEMEIRRDWEQRHPGTWDRFKGAIHHAWDRVRAKV